MSDPTHSFAHSTFWLSLFHFSTFEIRHIVVCGNLLFPQSIMRSELKWNKVSEYSQSNEPSVSVPWLLATVVSNLALERTIRIEKTFSSSYVFSIILYWISTRTKCQILFVIDRVQAIFSFELRCS